MPLDNPAQNELALAHEQQIAALTDPGLTDEERVRRFAEAARFLKDQASEALRLLSGQSPAYTVWWFGAPQTSLFACLPGCNCPVAQNSYGGADYPGIPSDIPPPDWRPTRATLEAFAHVQQEARHAV